MSILEDGLSTLISLANLPTIKLCEKTVTPPGVDGGGSNDLTSMKNTAWRTLAPKRLKTLTEASASVFYDPAVYDEIVAQGNINQLITVTFSDGSKIAFFGWLNTFTPDEIVEGEAPTASVTFIPSNRDLLGVETGPVYTPAP